MSSARYTDLDRLEAESIYILREVAAQFQRPVLLFSGGKDSAIMTRLAERAFRPGRFPFPLMLVDTGHNFPETLEYIHHKVADLGENLIIASVQESIDRGKARDESGPYPSRNRIQSVTLMDAIRENRFDAVIGGGRRDEEKARAKERIFSVRDETGKWDPANQRFEPWLMLDGRLGPGQHMRVFPLSNWTELDVWQYIDREKIELPSIYFSHKRKCIARIDGRGGRSLFPWSKFVSPPASDPVVEKTVRCRTVGDMTCTGVFESTASNVTEVIREILTLGVSERGGRLDDKHSETSMEDRKKEGYF